MKKKLTYEKEKPLERQEEAGHLGWQGLDEELLSWLCLNVTLPEPFIHSQAPETSPCLHLGTQKAGPTLGSCGRGWGQTSNNGCWSLQRNSGLWDSHPNASLPLALLPARSWREVECL